MFLLKNYILGAEKFSKLLQKALKDVKGWYLLKLGKYCMLH